MHYWLMKTEPSSFSVEDLAAAPRRTTAWDGVRNYQARNMLRDQMKRGDQAFLYYSSTEVPGIVAIVEVVKEGYPDPTAFDRKHHHYDPGSDPRNPRWFMVDVRLKRRLARTISLEQLRALAYGHRIFVADVDERSIEVDTPADLAKAEKYLGQQRN